MKTNAFFKTILLVMALGVAQMAAAQNMSVATLQHDGQTQAYYGADSFIEALSDAESGDLISLSSGYFNAPDSLNKAVVIQGAGMMLNNWNSNPTVIAGNLIVYLPENDKNGLVLEGLSMAHDNDIIIYSDVESLSIIKCKMRELDFDDITANNVLIDRCYIYDAFITGPEADGGLVVRNSFIQRFWGENSNPSNRYIHNCYIYSNRSNAGVASGKYENNIIAYCRGGSYCQYYNNIYYVRDGDTSSGIFIEGNQDVFYTINALFVQGSAPSGENADPQLTDEAAAEYLGNDGTQVGMYGGATPFTITPSCPQITSSEVAPQSDANGKLNVKITVEAGSN